jgi:hypothetical protein
LPNRHFQCWSSHFHLFFSLIFRSWLALLKGAPIFWAGGQKLWKRGNCFCLRNAFIRAWFVPSRLRFCMKKNIKKHQEYINVRNKIHLNFLWDEMILKTLLCILDNISKKLVLLWIFLSFLFLVSWKAFKGKIVTCKHKKSGKSIIR